MILQFGWFFKNFLRYKKLIVGFVQNIISYRPTYTINLCEGSGMDELGYGRDSEVKTTQNGQGTPIWGSAVTIPRNSWKPFKIGNGRQ